MNAATGDGRGGRPRIIGGGHPTTTNTVNARLTVFREMKGAAMAEHNRRVWRVKESFSFDEPSGRGWSMRVGDLIDESHPAFDRKGSKPYLEEVTGESGATQQVRVFVAGNDSAVSTSEASETATAAPGERRNVSAPRRAQPTAPAAPSTEE